MRGGVLQVLVGYAVQIVGPGQQMLVERAQDAQHADRFFAAGVEGLDLLALDRRVAALGEGDEGLSPHRAQQVAMQLDLGHRPEEGAVGRRDGEAGTGVGDVAGTHQCFPPTTVQK